MNEDKNLPRTKPIASKPYSENNTRKAWEHVVSGAFKNDAHITSIRSEILDSWKRSLALGVDAGSQASYKIVDENDLFLRHKKNAALRKAASAAFARLKPHLEDARTILILADDQGVIIDAIGDAGVLDQGQEIHLEIGGNWSEDTIGTNGIGTALRTGQPAYVHAAEHFAEGVKSWTCVGAPIRDPLTQTVIGVVDLSGPPQIFRQHNVALVLAAAREIEIALAEQRQAERTRLLEAFLMSDVSRAQDSVVLLDHNGRVLFRRGLEESPLQRIKELSVGYQLLPKLDELSDYDIARHMPENVEAKGIEWLKTGGATFGAAVIMKGNRKPSSKASLTRTIRPRSNVSEEPLHIVGSCPKMMDAISLAERVAQANVSVLIHGETGVGKELFARLIHSRLNVPDAPYVPVNCAAISSDLIGAELFGYSDGAFTGAVRGGRIGKFELANKGVLCLDEIADMPIELQPYLLRALEQRAIYRLGDSQRRPVDVRLVALTNRDLRQEIDKGHFRRDLFYRISVVMIEVPPLRERGDDIIDLLNYFSHYFAKDAKIPPMVFTESALRLLRRYQWPGNVRELRNVVQRFYLVKSDSLVTERDLPAEIKEQFENEEADSLEHILEGYSGNLESIEAKAIRRAISEEGGNLSKVAESLGISRPTLYRKMKRYHIQKP